MISFKTDHERHGSGRHTYRINVETDIKRYYDLIQDAARKCVDDSTKTAMLEDNEYVQPCCESVDFADGSCRIAYLCSGCECDLTPDNRGFFVHCPRCGKKIIYEKHMFLKEGLNAIR